MQGQLGWAETGRKKEEFSRTLEEDAGKEKVITEK